MNLKCLFGKHNLKYSYNHSMPCHINIEEAIKMFDDKRTYEVFICARCHKYFKKINGKFVLLSNDEMEEP